MSREPGKTARRSTSGRALGRALGRGAIWTAVGLLLIRGATSMVSPAGPSATREIPATAGDEAAAAFAVRFARRYLADPSRGAIAPFLAEGVHVGAGVAPLTNSGEVVQAEVAEVEDLGDGESILTVACELRDARTLYLAVPIARSRAGEVAALGAPSIVAGPGIAAGAEVERPRPLAGSDATGIEGLVSKFIPAYLSAEGAADLSYLLVPGTVIQPLRGELSFGSISGVDQLGDGEGPRRTVLVTVRAGDPGGGASYPLVYRLEVRRGVGDDRWYVAALQGASA